MAARFLTTTRPSKEWSAPPKPPPFEERDLAHRLVALGSERFPKGLTRFVRTHVNDESVAEIAARDGISRGYARRQSARTRRKLRLLALELGVAVLLALLLSWMARPPRTKTEPRPALVPSIEPSGRRP